MCKKKLISEKIMYLKEFQDIMLHLDAGVSLVTVIQNLNNFVDDSQNNIILSN